MRAASFLFPPLFLLLLPMATPAEAGPCTAVIDDTVAEMRAGADGWWSHEVEGLVRAAAGSACVKAQSGRYAATDGDVDSHDDVLAADEDASASAPVPAGDASNAQEATDSDDGSWSFGGMTFRSLSGSPGSKPYQRKRKADEEG